MWTRYFIANLTPFPHFKSCRGYQCQRSYFAYSTLPEMNEWCFIFVCNTYGNIVEIVFLRKIYCHSMKKYIIDMFFIITIYRAILLERNRSEIIKDVHSVTHDYGLKCNLIH